MTHHLDDWDIHQHVFPLTPAQQGLWLSEQLLDDPCAYAVAEQTQLHGTLDEDIFCQAATNVLSRTPATRMRVRLRDETVGAEAIGVSFDAPAPTVELIDTTDPHGWCKQALATPPEVTTSVVSHAALLRISEEEHVWFLRVHHMAMDGYAFSLINRELTREYRKLIEQSGEDASGASDQLSAHSISDYNSAVYGNDATRDDPDLSQAVDNLLASLRKAPREPLVFAGQSTQPERSPVTAPGIGSMPEVVDVIAALALMVMATRREAESSVVVGVHMMNRPTKQLLRTACNSQNIVPVVVDCAPQLTVAELRAQISQRWKQVKKLQSYRHEKLRESLNLTGEDALIDVALNIVPFAMKNTFGQATGRAVPVWDGPVEVATLDIRPGDKDSPSMLLEVPEGSVSTPTRDGFAEMLGNLLRQVIPGTSAAVPDQCALCDIDLLPASDEPGEPDESGEGTARWAVNYPDAQVVAQLPAGIAPATATDATSTAHATTAATATGAGIDEPAAPLEQVLSDFASHQGALHGPDAHLSRAQAMRRIEALRDWLSRQLPGRAADRVSTHKDSVQDTTGGTGVTDVRVAIRIPRSTWSVLAPIAILSYGAAFVPIDEAWPDQRIEAVLGAAKPHAIIDREVIAELEAAETAAEQTAATPDNLASPIIEVSGETPAYLLFTSGSSGVPKGVVVCRAQLDNFIRTVGELYLPVVQHYAGHTGPLAVVFEHSFAFDSGFSPFAQYLLGHHCFIPDEQQLHDPVAHVDYLNRHHIEMMDISPAVLEELLATGLDPLASSLAAVFIGGDACSESLWQRLREFADGGVVTANAYGPTENTVDSTIAWVADHRHPSIGHGLPYQRTRVVDVWGRQCPVGVAGELCVAGQSLSVGYFNDQAKTEQVFVTGPDGVREYHTGDLVRREPDGSLSFIGRADNQMSLRGVRIEAGEVEAAMLDSGLARQALVMVRNDGSGNRLIGYFVGTPACPTDAELIAVHFTETLRERLPLSSVPTAFVRLEQFPRTDRGKIDRKSLPAPQVLVGTGLSFEDMNSLQRTVARMIADAVGMDAAELTTDSDLFALGGHSLTAVRLIGQLNSTWGGQIALKDVFRHPTVDGLADLLVTTAGSVTSDAVGADTEEPDEPGDASPLTMAQRRLWFIEQLAGPSPTYTIPMRIEFPAASGGVDKTVLRDAVGDLILMYPSLRSTYPMGADGQPTMHRWTATEVRGALDSMIIDGDQRRGWDQLIMDITRELPLKVVLGTADAGDATAGATYTVTLVFHHIAADGWAISTLLTALSNYYTKRASGTSPQIVVDERQARSRSINQADLDWWLDYTSGIPEEIDLPADRQRPAVRSIDGGEEVYELGIKRSQQINQLCASQGVTPFMLLKGVLAGLLTRTGAGEDIPIGTISSERADAAEQSLVTFLANTVVTRTDTSGNPSFSELFERVRKDTVAVLSRTHVPFDDVVEAVNPQRASHRHPLFQVLMVVQDTVAETVEFGPGLTARAEVQGTGTAKFDLTCEIKFVDGQIVLRWEYAKDIFDAASIRDIHQWYIGLLDRAIANPNAKLWEGALSQAAVDDALTEAARMLEYRASRVELNHADPNSAKLTNAPEATTLTAALEHSLHTHADAIALVEDTPEARTWTYGELAAATATRMHALLAKGVRPGDRVGLLYPRTAEQVIAVLAVVRTGAAYVPLDPNYPVDRLAAVVKDAHPVVVLCADEVADVAHEVVAEAARAEFISAKTSTAEQAAAHTKLVPVSTDSQADEYGAELLASLTGKVDTDNRTMPTPDDPAYLIFTSGSTGRPKGVVIPQRNVIRLLAATEDWFGFGPQDVWTMFHSYAFDFAVWEIYGALLTGGRLVVVSHETSRNPAEFAQLVRREKVTVLNQTPSAFGQFVLANEQAGADENLPGGHHLRFIILGGEAMDPAMVRRWFATNEPGQPKVINMYGITETTVHVTYREIHPSDVDKDTAVTSPIGEPIPDLSVYLIDAYGNPVPRGVIGEIHVGGAGVAGGYAGRLDLTDRQFVPDPFVAQCQAAQRHGAASSCSSSSSSSMTDAAPVSRMYRSGDLAVRTRDDELHFKGRSDRQVQLRGFRIELGEVEAAATALPEVEWAFATVIGKGHGQRLVVYVLGPDTATADPLTVRSQIAENVPAQMTPSAVMIIPEVPLTVNGKLDTKALPEPVVAATGGRAPETWLERMLCRRFADVLGVDAVSPEDSFFDLGGHSLLAVELTLAITRELVGAGLDDQAIRVGTLMTNPTPELLASRIDSGVDDQADLQVLIPLCRPDENWSPSDGGVHCIHPAGGLSWCYSGLPKHLPSGIPVWGLQAKGVLDPDAQPGSLADMADEYIARIVEVQPTGPYHILGWSLGGMVAHVMAAQMAAAGMEVGVVGLLDAYPSEAETGVAEPPMADALSAVLAMAGLEDDMLGEDPTVEDLEKILAKEASPMAGLPERTLAAVVRTYRNTARILREYDHGSFAGKVVFYQATRAGIGPVHDPHEWDRHLSQPMEIIEVDCTHREMTRPGPIQQIGRDVAARLQRGDWGGSGKDAIGNEAHSSKVNEQKEEC